MRYLLKKTCAYFLGIIWIGLIASSTCPAQEEIKVIRQGLISWWRFDEGKGTISKDASNTGNDGTIYGAKWVAGKVNSALYFDGTDDYVDCGNDASLKLTGDFTVEIWVKLDKISMGRNVCIIDYIYTDGYSLFKNHRNKLKAYRGYKMQKGGVETGAICGVKYLLADTWYHIAYVVNTSVSTGYIYINGELDNSGTLDNKPGFTKGNLFIGKRGDGYWFNGIIDEIRIYNRPLSDTEICDNYTAAVRLSSPPQIFCSLSTATYYLNDGKIEPEVRINNILTEELAGMELRAAIKKDKKIISSEEITNISSRKFRLSLDISTLEPDSYSINLSLTDKDGKIIGEAEQNFSITKGPFD